MDMDNVYDEFPDRIAKAIELAGGPSEAARKTGVTLATLSRWKKGEADPSRSNLVKLCGAAAVNVAWLAAGEGVMKKGQESVSDQNTCNGANHTQEPCICADTLGNPVDLSEFVFIPRYNLKAAAGHGAATAGEKPMFSMSFRRYWVDNYLRIDPKDLSVLSVKGDSMEGVLNDRDVILINHADTSPTSGLYVLRVEGDLIVKRVQKLPGGKLVIMSANQDYQPFEVDPANPTGDFAVIGRVVWFGRQI